MTKKDIALQQIKYFKDIESMGYNIVTCGNCGTTLIHPLIATEINCLCGLTLDPCDCPDLWANGDENNYENKTMKTYRISYAYGGRFLGDSKSYRDIKAESKEKAIEIFKKEYSYEIIYSVFEINVNGNNVVNTENDQ